MRLLKKDKKNKLTLICLGFLWRSIASDPVARNWDINRYRTQKTTNQTGQCFVLIYGRSKLGTGNVNWSTYKKATPYWSGHRRRTAESQTGIRESGKNTEGSTANLNDLKEKDREKRIKNKNILPTIVCETVNRMQ